jgi:hypothetical protein
MGKLDDMPSQSPALEAESIPGVASAEEGKVILDGPDGVAVTMTAEAASGTAASLLRAVDEAHEQLRAREEPPTK